MLRKIWKPDTFVYNGKKSYLHTITTPNRFVRCQGNVWFCLMPTYPDCFLTAGSSTPSGWPSGLTASWISRTSLWIAKDVLWRSDHVSKLLYIKTSDYSCLVGYTRSDLLYQWTAGRGVNIASDMKLSQFDLISTPTGNETVRLNHGKNRTYM